MREVHISFVGIDSWNRAVFHVNGKKIFIGNAEKTFSLDDVSKSDKEAKEWFRKENPEMVYFGNSFDCEPDGDCFSSDIKFILD